MSNQVIHQLTDEAYAELCYKASQYEDLKAELEQIRTEIEIRLHGVNIALDVLVKDHALIPTMEAAKTTLEEVLEIIDKALKEQS